MPPVQPRLPIIWKHPVLSAVVALLATAALVFAGLRIADAVDSAPIACGRGMELVNSPLSCVGVDLDGGPFAKQEPARLQALRAQVNQADAQVTGSSYVTVVLLLDFSPVAGVDTVTYDALYPVVEGALTAAWRANHTAAFGSRDLPVKLVLGNMGSQYGSWPSAVRLIAANAKAQHITAVTGLGQSTDETRAAAAWLSDNAHLPVIGATVTGDDMNTQPQDMGGGPTRDFFRVSTTNSESVKAAAAFVAGMRPSPASIAIVEDNASQDDYVSTLVTAAGRDLPAPGRTLTKLPFTSPPPTDRNLSSGVSRHDYLVQQFTLMHANLCQAAPSLVYFAGRGDDLDAFVETWVQQGTCGLRNLAVISGDDAATEIGDPTVDQAIAAQKISLFYTALSSPDEWQQIGCSAAATQNFDQFRAAFTGQPDGCTHQRLAPDDHATPLAFDANDLSSGHAMLTHDAVAAAVSAARNDAMLLTDPESQVGVLDQMNCTHMIPGASGWIALGPGGNPLDRPVPVVRVNGDGTTSTVQLTWPGGVPLLQSPQPGQTRAPGC
ncbi:ABC transporter substrate-binding protein [Streptacidiphilus neutrinimicus]|uniref:ABC transporter substrate-binding protein n=1 Tax=Streptacidiphilus neutrinimicus TaxID=105420 RepID=UPI0005A63E29|nr:hypothetical protein [Streptacidiphilus neutrinimicus]